LHKGVIDNVKIEGSILVSENLIVERTDVIDVRAASLLDG